MSIGEKGICVRILEKEFRVACSKNQEQALREAALYLDSKMRDIRKEGRVIGVERIAVTAALNIANELLMLRGSVADKGEMFSERLKILQEKIDNALKKRGKPKLSAKASCSFVDPLSRSAQQTHENEECTSLQQEIV